MRFLFLPVFLAVCFFAGCQNSEDQGTSSLDETRSLIPKTPTVALPISITLPEDACPFEAPNRIEKVLGTWYLNANMQTSSTEDFGYRLTLHIERDIATGSLAGKITDLYGNIQLVDRVQFSPASNILEFRRVGLGFWQ